VIRWWLAGAVLGAVAVIAFDQAIVRWNRQAAFRRAHARLREAVEARGPADYDRDDGMTTSDDRTGEW
jgi:hypothetical protein